MIANTQTYVQNQFNNLLIPYKGWPYPYQAQRPERWAKIRIKTCLFYHHFPISRLPAATVLHKPPIGLFSMKMARPAGPSVLNVDTAWPKHQMAYLLRNCGINAGCALFLARKLKQLRGWGQLCLLAVKTGLLLEKLVGVAGFEATTPTPPV